MRKRASFIFAVIASVCLALPACEPHIKEWGDEHPELYSMAVYSVLGARGILSGSLSRKVTVIEEDSYGRVMFLYTEGKQISTYSLHISQTTHGGYIYFFPDHHFISAPTDEFPEEAVDELKRRNDWNRDMDYETVFRISDRAEVVREKAAGPLRDAQVERFHQRALGRNVYPLFVYFTTDNYGRSMYLGYARGDSRDIVMMFSPDGSFDLENGFFELPDDYDHQDALKQFKEQNNWNRPLPQD